MTHFSQMTGEALRAFETEGSVVSMSLYHCSQSGDTGMKVTTGGVVEISTNQITDSLYNC